MDFSLVGIAVFAALYLAGWYLGSALFIGLMASLSFGATSFVRLSALGGSTPLIYALFALALLANGFLRRDAPEALRRVFARQRCAWGVLLLMLVAFSGAILLPRIFAGETVGMIPVDKIYREFPLQPSTKNVTQAGYFVLGALAYFAVSIWLVEQTRHRLVVKAFFVLCVTHAACGLIDLVAKRFGENDVFELFRTANYVMLSDQTIAGFPRLTGAQTEASVFAMMTLMCLAFSFTYWRRTGFRLARDLVLINLVLALLSTSSTAYVGLVVLSVPVVCRMIGSLWRSGRFSAQDRQVIVFVALAMVVSVVFLATFDRRASISDLIDETLLEKASTDSGVERMHFNAISLRNFIDTFGLGVGLGSSRASGWPLAVLGQLGLAGAILLGALVVVLWRGMTGVPDTAATRDLIAAGDAVCAAALGWLVGVSISAGSADPGIVFFVALAVVTSWRRSIQDTAGAA